jgi:hypothetical protein
MIDSSSLDPAAIRFALETIAHKIDNIDPKAANRLRMLASAINGDPKFEAWAKSDIFKMIDPDAIIEQFNGTRKDIQRFRSDLVDALARASLIFYNRQSHISPRDNLDNLDIAAQQLKNIAVDNAQILDAMAQRTFSTFEQIAKDMTVQIQKSSNYFAQLGDFVSGLVQFSSEMQQVINKLQYSNQSLVMSNEDLVISIKSIIVAFTELSAQQKTSEATANKATLQLREIADMLTTIITIQERGRQELAHTLSTVNLSLEGIAPLLTGFKTFTTQQNSLFQKLNEERRAQSDLAEVVSETASTVGSALNSMNNNADVLKEVGSDMKSSAAELRAIVENMGELLRIQSTLPESMNETIQSFALTAEAIKKSSNGLDESVMALHHEASQSLLADQTLQTSLHHITTLFQRSLMEDQVLQASLQHTTTLFQQLAIDFNTTVKLVSQQNSNSSASKP